MSKLADAMDPLNIFHKKKKSKVFVPVPTAAKQGSAEEMAQRRKETSDRLKTKRRPVRTSIEEEEDQFMGRGSKLFGE